MLYNIILFTKTQSTKKEADAIFFLFPRDSTSYLRNTRVTFKALLYLEKVYYKMTYLPHFLTPKTLENPPKLDL